MIEVASDGFMTRILASECVEIETVIENKKSYVVIPESSNGDTKIASHTLMVDSDDLDTDVEVIINGVHLSCPGNDTMLINMVPCDDCIECMAIGYSEMSMSCDEGQMSYMVGEGHVSIKATSDLFASSMENFLPVLAFGIDTSIMTPHIGGIESFDVANESSYPICLVTPDKTFVVRPNKKRLFYVLRTNTGKLIVRGGSVIHKGVLK